MSEDEQKADDNNTKTTSSSCKTAWYHIGMDFIGPISPTTHNGNRFIFTMCDYFTKFGWTKALPTKEAVNVITALRQIRI